MTPKMLWAQKSIGLRSSTLAATDDSLSGGTGKITAAVLDDLKPPNLTLRLLDEILTMTDMIR